MRTFGGDFKLIINQNYGHMEVEIFGLEDHGGGHPVVIGYDGEHLVEQEVNHENEMSFNFKPLLRISMFQFESLVKAFVEIANERKIHTEGESVLQGKLTATETHLADMRELTKKLTDHLIK
jgi:hypothetical protein